MHEVHISASGAGGSIRTNAYMESLQELARFIIIRSSGLFGSSWKTRLRAPPHLSESLQPGGPLQQQSGQIWPG
eukprot:scaffold75043_cov48-Prasinocladus_malaysianus.AAC.2